MPSETPLPEQNIAVSQAIKHKICSGRQPFLEFFPLAVAWEIQISASRLRSNVSFRIKGNSQIRAINLFFNDKLMAQKRYAFRLREDLVTPDRNILQRREVGCGRKLEELVLHAPSFSPHLALQ